MTPQESLETFQSNVRRLFGHAFVQKVGKAKVSYFWKLASNRTVRDVVRPSEQIISGYAALVRGFMTEDDEWSLNRLPQVYHRIGASRFQQTKLKEYRKKIHRWQQWPCGFSPSGRHFTNRDLLDLFIYGRVLHQTQKKEFDELTKDPMSRDLLMHVVCRCLVTYSGCLGAVYTRNQMVLSRATGQPGLPLP